MHSKYFKIPLLILTIILNSACTNGSTTSTFSTPNHVAVDNSNDRLFLTQANGEVFVLTASTIEEIGDQPVIDESTNESIHALLPFVINNFGVFATSTTSRLFFMGALQDDSGNFVLNRIRVIDFDGTTFSQASFSPLTLSDGDENTDETDNAFADLLVDQANSRIYISDTSGKRLYVLSATDGSTVTAPINIAGIPQGLAQAGNRLFVCNSSTVDAEQVVTVVNTTDFSTTQIDLDAGCTDLAVASNSNGTALIAKNSADNQVLIRQVDESTFAASTAITTATDGFTNGSLSSGAGISSAISDIVATVSSDGRIFVYVPQQDGNLQEVVISADFSSFTSQTLSTAATTYSDAVVYEPSAVGTTLFLAAKSGYLVNLDVGGTDVDLKN